MKRYALLFSLGLAGVAMADAGFSCRGVKGHFGVYVGSRYMSSSQIKSGFNETLGTGEQFRIVTNYGTNHPIVDALRIEEAPGGKLRITSPREDRLPMNVLAPPGIYRFEIEAPDYVECTITLGAAPQSR